MQLIKILILCTLISVYTTILSFFWVPNRYTAPYWPCDTHITNHFIDSWDLYLGSSYGDSDFPQYTTVEFIGAWYQTMAAGFFIEATMPFSSIHPKKADTSPLTPLKNGFCYQNCSIIVGWGLNHDTLPIIDFVDLMIRCGLVTPAHIPPLHAYAIETMYGYPQWGIPVSWDIALGYCNWMTFGFHASIIQFIDAALVWELNPFCKIDHFLAGLSAWFGYSYSGAHHDIGSKILFLGQDSWHMHTLHYGLEYEFIQSYFPLHPRLGFYFNQYIGGEHCMHRSNFGFTMGLDINW